MIGRGGKGRTLAGRHSMHGAVLCLVGALQLVTPSGASAQSYAMDRGVWIVGGTASLSHGASSTAMSLSPQVGYFFARGLAGVATLDYTRGWYQTEDQEIYGLGPGLTYYFRHGPARLHPFLSASGRYQQITVSTQVAFPGVPRSRHYFAWEGSGGLALLLARNVGATGAAYFTQFIIPENAPAPSQTSNQYGLRFGISIYLY